MAQDPRSFALTGIVLVTFLVALEGTVVSTAMPRTVAELGGSDHIAWVFSAYLGALAITGPVWGNLADRLGARPVYLASIALFLLGSAWAASVQSMPELVAARFVQGVGGGGLTPLGQTILSLIYDRQDRARAQSWLVTAFGIASLFGPVLGGYLTENFSWRWNFLLSLPFGGAGALLLVLFLRLPPVNLRRTPFDGPGLVLFVAWMLATLAWTDRYHGLTGLLGLALGLGLWHYSRRQEHPFLPLPLLRVAVFRGATRLALLLGAGIFGGVSFFPLFLQRHFQLNSAVAGRALLPLMLCWVASSAIAPRLALRVGYAPVVTVSALGLVAAYLSLSCSWHPGAVLVAQLGLGMAGGLSFSPLTLAIQEVVPREQLGQATSAIVFLRTLGATLGTAVLGSMLHGSGFAAMFGLGLGLSLAAALACAPFRRGLSRETAGC
jgi:MFS family permease